MALTPLIEADQEIVNECAPWHRSIRFWAPAASGVAIVALTAALGPPWLALTTLGALLGLELAGTLYTLARGSEIERLPNVVRIPLRLSSDLTLFQHYQELGQYLFRVGQFADPIFRALAIERLRRVASEHRQLAGGQITFRGTESWRLAYEQLLRGAGIHTYRSVAWMRSDSYWADEPGRKSLRLNFELQNSGQVTIERIVILPFELWPGDEPLPVEPVRGWLFEQQQRGIPIRLVRLSDLDAEPDLIADMGIYGSRAVGVQELDLDCRTIRFTLSFDFGEVLAAEARWSRLAVYAASLPELLHEEKLANLN